MNGVNKRFNPYANRGGGNFQRQRAAPMFSFQNKNLMDVDDDDDPPQQEPTPDPNRSGFTFAVERENGAYIGWRLYFPEKEFKQSHDLVRRIKAMEEHLKTFPHWYDVAKIEKDCSLPLKLQNLEEDFVFNESWPEFPVDLETKTTQTLACVALAMHDMIVKNQGSDDFQHQKIYARPIGFNSRIKLSEAHKTTNKLVSLTGMIVREEPPKTNVKMLCYRCAMCSTELVVRQNPTSSNYVHPSTCIKGCPARGHFSKLLTSPYTIFQSKQLIWLQESVYVEKQDHNIIHVQLNQEQVESLGPGAMVTITGIVKHEKEKTKFMNKTESKVLKTYFKCLSVEQVRKLEIPKTEAMAKNYEDFILAMQGEPSPFRLLVHSLCPLISGREEIKAGLVLGLLSGADLKSNRSESHVLLVGNPGTGKSKLLQACCDISAKGLMVSGPTTTAVGLTAAVGKNGTIDAGALILTDGGVCCIDEFDKMSSHTHVLLEAMEQQIISITKCGAMMNAKSRVVILAAANPVGSIYDNSKMLTGNMKMTTPMMTRFDLIFRVLNQTRGADPHYLAQHKTFRGNQSSNASFFSSTGSTSSSFRTQRDDLTWLHSQPGEVIDTLNRELLKFYVEYVRENFKPELSPEARQELSQFYMELTNLIKGNEVQPITFRQLEALIRLTLSRARADMQHVATREHARDVINLMKFSMVDIFGLDEADSGYASSINSTTLSMTSSVSTLSKPKQIKAFLNRLESEGNDCFTYPELKAIATELGVTDYRFVIDSLNDQGRLLKIVDGYRLV